jgi:Terminase RNaseH-like domain
MPSLQLWPFLERLPIRTKSAKIQHLRRTDAFAWAQRAFVAEIERQYNSGQPVRIIVLKGRQLGLSTLSEAVLFYWCFLHPGSASLVLSKEKDDSEYLFGMLKRYWEGGPMKGLFPLKYNRIGYLEWDGLGSSVTTSTAEKADVGRGKTVQAVHGSEVARWSMADEIVGSLSEAVPDDHGTVVLYESTAQGVGGYFHDEWLRAVDPSGDKSPFTPMFFPWYMHNEYEIAKSTLQFGELDEEERDLLLCYRHMTIPKLAWRRRKMQSYLNPEMFKEEYPNSWQEAFLSTGFNVFPLEKLQACYDPDVPREQGFLANEGGRLMFIEDEGGHFFVYKRPDPARRRQYVVAVDPTWTVDGDPACIQVLDRASMEQVAVWHGSANPTSIGEISLAIALWYGPKTMVNTEVQGGGREVMRVWREADYPNIWMDRRPDMPQIMKKALGWNSTYETKRAMLAAMQGVIVRRALVLHHAATFYEMTRYMHDPDDDTYGPSRRSGHDDCVISLGIAIYSVVTEQSTLDWAAYSAPAPAYIPGMTQPRAAGFGTPYEPNPGGIGTMLFSDDPYVEDEY